MKETNYYMNLEPVTGVGLQVIALVFYVAIGSFPKGRCSEKMQSLEMRLHSSADCPK